MTFQQSPEINQNPSFNISQYLSALNGSSSLSFSSLSLFFSRLVGFQLSRFLPLGRLIEPSFIESCHQLTLANLFDAKSWSTLENKNLEFFDETCCGQNLILKIQLHSLQNFNLWTNTLAKFYTLAKVACVKWLNFISMRMA